MSVYLIYAEGRKVAERKTWKGVKNTVGKLRKESKHGYVYETFPYMLMPDKIVWEF